MKLSPTEMQQAEMRFAHFDGAPGILVSGIVWVVAAVVCAQFGVSRGVWTLLVGGAVIYPIGMLFAKALGRPGNTDKANALNQLAMASTIWLIVCCAMAYGLYLLKPQLFFPAMLATIGSRYLVFATVYGKAIYWALGISLVAAGNASLFLGIAPALAAAIGGALEILFALLVFSRASRSSV